MAAHLELQFAEAPTKIYGVHQEYVASGTPQRTPNSNFLRGVRWSPDGACLLTASDDNCLRIFDTPLEAFSYGPPESAGEGAAEDAAAAGSAPAPAGQRVPAQPPAAAAAAADGDSLQPALRIQEGELLYDFCWYSQMSAADPASCCLATTGRAHPVHLWDALTGQLRCSYRAYNELDEVAPAHSLAFSLDGGTLYCGFNRAVRAFRVERPGRDCSTLMAHKKGTEGLPGIISCMAPNPDRSGMLAVGSYSGGAALLDARTRELLCLLEGGHVGGLTHLCFSADGNFLYTGARKDGAIRCWDVRYSSGVVYSIERQSGGTNQRMHFDIEPCGRHLATGGEDGVVRLFDLRDGRQAAQFAAADDTVSGIHFHPFLPLLATASGQRRYPLAPADDESDASSASDSDGGMAGTGSSSDTSSSSDSESDSGCAAGASLSGMENVLQVWRCSATLAQAVEAVAAEGEAAAEDTDMAAADNGASYEEAPAGRGDEPSLEV